MSHSRLQGSTSPGAAKWQCKHKNIRTEDSSLLSTHPQSKVVCRLTDGRHRQAADGAREAGDAAGGKCVLPVAVVAATGARDLAEPRRGDVPAPGVALPDALAGVVGELLMGRPWLHEEEEEHAQGGNGRCSLLRLHLLARTGEEKRTAVVTGEWWLSC